MVGFVPRKTSQDNKLHLFRLNGPSFPYFSLPNPLPRSGGELSSLVLRTRTERAAPVYLGAACAARTGASLGLSVPVRLLSEARFSALAGLDEGPAPAEADVSSSVASHET